MAGELGLSADLAKLPFVGGRALAPDIALFSESQGRIVVTVSLKNRVAFEKIFAKLPHAHVGEVEKSRTLSIRDGGKPVIKATLTELLRAYRSRFKNW
jgi:phosphoribosylformylglycinamidine (FGAM) synthase-like enzyme